MKKLFKIFLTAAAAVLFGTYAVSAQTWNSDPEPGKIKIKVNVKDFATGRPMPDVSVAFHLHWSTGKDENFITIKSGVDGSGWDAILFEYRQKPGVSGYSYYAYSPNYDGKLFDLNQLTHIDCDGLNGYSWKIVAGKVRNYKGGANSEALYQSAGYDNAKLTKDNKWQSQGAVIEFDVYFEHSGISQYTVYFDSSKATGGGVSDPVIVSANGKVSQPSGTPVCAEHPSWDFLYWACNGAEWNFNSPVTQNMTLEPVWSNPNVQGIIHVKVYMWDHDGYKEHPKSKVAETYINGVPGEYKAEDFTQNYGWTTIPIKGATMILKCYLNDGKRDYWPVGYPHTNDDWRKNETYSRVTTDNNGEATYTLTQQQLQNMKSWGLGVDASDAYNKSKFQFQIDNDPVEKQIGYYDRGYGDEAATFAWDYWQTSGNNDKTGLVGVRWVPEGGRHTDHPSVYIAKNENDAVIITNEMLTNGFEFTFVCYLVPSAAVEFDLNGGQLSKPAVPANFPIQTFEPINSMSQTQTKYQVTNPGNPTWPVADDHLVFAGWYEVLRDAAGNETLASSPYDFSREVTKSFKLRALYDDQVYTVRWANEGWTDDDNKLLEKDVNMKAGAYPTYDHSSLPTSSNALRNFVGWDLYTASVTGAYTFGSQKYDKTDFVAKNSMTEVTISEAQGLRYYVSPKPVNGDQIYIAVFEDDPNVVWKIRNNQTIAKYKSLYDAVNNVNPSSAVTGFDLTLADGDILEFHGNTTEPAATVIGKSNITVRSASSATIYTANTFSVTNTSTATQVGSITVTGSNVTFTNIKLQGNTFANDGNHRNAHLLYVNGGTVNIMTGCTVTGHSSADGAAILVGSGTLNVSGGTFSNNANTNAGNYGGAIDNRGTLNLTGGSFSGNSSKDSKGNAISQRGTLYIGGNPSFDSYQDIYLECERTSDTGSGTIRTIIKNNTITSSNKIPVRLGTATTNLYAGRNVLESGSANVVTGDLEKFNVLNQSDLTAKILELAYMTTDAGSGKPVLELVELPTRIQIIKSGLKTGESAVFTVSKGSDVRTVVLTGKNSNGDSVSKYVSNLEPGQWTITENTSWSWAYTTTEASKTCTVQQGKTIAVTFTNTSKENVPKHAEASKNNDFR